MLKTLKTTMPMFCFMGLFIDLFYYALSNVQFATFRLIMYIFLSPFIRLIIDDICLVLNHFFHVAEWVRFFLNETDTVVANRNRTETISFLKKELKQSLIYTATSAGLFIIGCCNHSRNKPDHL